MSLITCCPACGTMFRVVPDQLRISDGWVRCGHCAEVFDATAHMADEQPPPPPAAKGPPAFLPTQPGFDDGVPLPRATRGQAPAAFLPTQPGFGDEPIPAAMPPRPPPAAAAEAAAPVPPQAQNGDSELQESPLDQPFVFRRSDLGMTEDLAAARQASPAVPPAPPVARRTREPEEDDHELHDVSFVRQARRRAWWRRPMVRAALALAAVLLAALLALQLAVHDRHRLAVAEPGMRPWLEEVCLRIGCRIEAPRHIETLAIENSAFNKLRGDAYRLSFTLRNNATFQVAAPALELTLTDAQDQPVLRRVLMPTELGAPAPVIAAGAEWTASVPVAVNPGGPGTRIAGYRLLAFYP